MQPTLLDAVALPTEPPTEIRLFKDGWNDTTKGKFLLDAQGAALILADFASHGIELAMDFDHSTYGMTGTKRDVPGYIGALEYRPGEGLFATKVRWTKVGLAAITPGPSRTLPEYRYFSPAIRFDADTGRILAIEPVALVTWPGTKNQPPLVMSSAATDTEKHKMNPQLLMLLGLATTATESDVLLKLTALSKENAETLTANKALSACAKELVDDVIAEVAQLLGHTSITTTERYARVADEHLHGKVASMATLGYVLGYEAKSESTIHLQKTSARNTRFEPVTFGFGGQRSIQLS